MTAQCTQSLAQCFQLFEPRNKTYTSLIENSFQPSTSVMIESVGLDLKNVQHLICGVTYTHVNL